MARLREWFLTLLDPGREDRRHVWGRDEDDAAVCLTCGTYWYDCRTVARWRKR